MLQEYLAIKMSKNLSKNDELISIFLIRQLELMSLDE